MNTEQYEINKLLKQDWELTVPDTITEDELLELLAKRVVYIIERNPEQFFQLMYRLDIPESKLNNALVNQDAAMEIAHLIYNRQLMKIRSRQLYKQNNHSEDAELKW